MQTFIDVPGHYLRIELEEYFPQNNYLGRLPVGLEYKSLDYATRARFGLDTHTWVSP